MHAREHRIRGGLGHGHGVGGLLVIDIVDLGVIVGLYGLQQVGIIVLAVPGQGGHIVGHLQGGKQVITLADGGGEGLPVGPLQLVVLGIFRGGQGAGGIADLDARGLAQAELQGIVVDELDAREAAHLIEEVVARDGDGLGHIHLAVGGPGRAPQPALGLGAGVVGINALVADLGGGGDDAVFQGGHGGDGLEDGAGGVNAVHGAVEEGQAVILQELGIVPGDILQVVGGVGGQGQHLAAAHAHHHGGGAPLVAVLVDHALDGLGQGLFAGDLEVDVDGQGHGAAGLGLAGIELAGDVALGVPGHQALAVAAPEPGLKGLLCAALADQGVHGVALGGVVLPVLRVNAGDAPQNVGGAVGVVDPLGGDAGVDPGKVPVGDLAEELHGDILGEHIAAAAAKLIAHPGDEPLLGGGIGAVIQLPEGAKGRHSRRRRGVGGELPGLEIGGEVLRQLGGGVGIGRRPGDGQGIRPLHLVLLTEVNEPPDGGVEGGVLRKDIPGELQRVDLLVGYQHLAVAVGDDAAAGLHRLLGGIGGNGLRPVLIPLPDLVDIEADDENTHHRQKGGSQKGQAQAVRLVFFHEKELLSRRLAGSDEAM